MTRYLSDDAERLVQSVRDGNVDVQVLINTYDSWSSSEPPPDENLGEVAFEDAMLRTARERLRLRSSDIGWIESVGDALDVVTEVAPVEVRNAWHAAKVRALSSSDREKRQLVFRHLVAADYEDEVVLVGLMESLSRDDQMLALAFVSTAATQLNPGIRKDVIDMIVDEIETLERRGSSRAAYYATLLDSIFENHPAIIPSEQLMAKLERIVTECADPASFAAIVDLFSRVLQRTGDIKYIERWLATMDGRLWTLALSVLQGSDIDSWANNTRQEIHNLLADARDRFSSAEFASANLSIGHMNWIGSALRKELTRCA